MKVFVDNCLSPVLASTLAGYLGHRHGEAFHIKDLPCGRHAADEEWISFLSPNRSDWLVLTGDRRIHRNGALRAAYRQAGLRGFVLAPSYQRSPVNQQAAILLWRWPDIESLSRLTAPPFLFELPINRTSRIKQLPF